MKEEEKDTPDILAPPAKECRGGRVCLYLDNKIGLEAQVKTLLGCRAFLWDMLLEGEWTGCSRKLVRELVKLYGANEVSLAFEGGNEGA